MHPKYWKFPGGRRFMDAATGDEGGKSAGGGGGTEPTEAEKAAAAEAERKKAEEAAAAGGGKKPTDEEAKLLKEVMQKKDALKAREAELAAAQERLKAFDGIDPAAVRKLLDDQKSAEEAQLVAKGEFDTLKSRMAEEHAKSTSSLQAQIADLTAKLATKDSVIDDLSVGAQFSQSKLIADELTLTQSKARALYGAHFDVVDGQVVAFDKPRGASGRVQLVDQYGKGFGFEDALRKILEADPDRDHLFKSKVKPGAGSESKQTSKTIPPTKNGLDSVSKIGAGLAGLNLLGEPMK